MQMYDKKNALFSYSSRLDENGMKNDFVHSSTLRYTINSLVGIQKAQLFHKTEMDFNRMINRFLDLHAPHITNAGDEGLLLYLLASSHHHKQHDWFEKLEKIVRQKDTVLSLTLQEVCWIFLGLVRYAYVNKADQGASASEKFFKDINRHFLNKDTLLPFHCLKTWRKPFVSFGAIVYFLWSLYEYSQVFGDKYAGSLFKESCLRVIGLQQDMGEWPWFINADTFRIMDLYQIYSVHQDSMAMLFLLPAKDAGIGEAGSAITKGYRWLFGANELSEKMIVPEPFFIYRSIRRKGILETRKRYLRSLRLSLSKQQGKKARSTSLEINRECRSYHLGWILFVWSGREDFEEFTELKDLGSNLHNN